MPGVEHQQHPTRRIIRLPPEALHCAPRQLGPIRSEKDRANGRQVHFAASANLRMSSSASSLESKKRHGLMR